jgi:hypothetical protein
MSIRIRTLEDASEVLAYLAIGIVLACACVLFLYAHPNADDFCLAGKAVTLGLVDGIKHEYFNWSGRWAEIAIHYGGASLFDLVEAYSVLLTLVAMILAFSLFVFFKTLFGHGLSTKFVMMMAVSVFALHWVTARSSGQTFYWWSGAVTYHLTLACMLLLFAGLLSIRNDNRLVRLLQAGLLCILAFFSTGLHELFGLILCIILGVSTAIAFTIRHPDRTIWGVVFLATVSGFFVVVGAPGNEFRQLDTGQVVKYGDLGLALALTLKQGIYYSSRWVLDVSFLSGTLFFIMSPRFRAISLPRLFRQRPNWRLIVPTAWVAVLIVAFFGPSWALGRTMPPRSVDAIHVLFLIGWIATVFVFTRWPLDKRLDDHPVTKSIRAFALAVFALNLLSTGNTFQAARDLVSGRVAKYDQSMQHRYDQIRSDIEQGRIDVRLPKLGDRPKIFFARFGWAGIRVDPGYWQNQCAARFYGLRSIAIEQ